MTVPMLRVKATYQTNEETNWRGLRELSRRKATDNTTSITSKKRFEKNDGREDSSKVDAKNNGSVAICINDVVE